MVYKAFFFNNAIERKGENCIVAMKLKINLAQLFIMVNGLVSWS